MSGRNQHYIPQYYLRGFAIPPELRTGKKDKIWTIRKNGSAFASALDRTASQRDFYSDLTSSEAESLDDAITGYEHKFNSMLDTARALRPGDSCPPDLAAELAVHLITRNAHFRGTFGHALRGLGGTLLNVFSDDGLLEEFLGLRGRDATSNFAERIRDVEQAKALKDAGLPEEVIQQVAFTVAKENFSILFRANLPAMAKVFADLISEAGGLIAKGHRDLLSEMLVPPAIVERLSKLNWRVLATEETLPLPDCIALGATIASGWAPLLTSNTNELTAVVLPLSSRTILWATREPNTELPQAIDELLVRHSQDAFYACTDALQEFQGEIGADSTRSIDAMIADSFRKHSASANIPASTRLDIAFSPHESRDLASPSGMASYSYSLSFDGCADEVSAQHIADVVRDLIGVVSDLASPHLLESIVFTHQYEDTVANVDTGLGQSSNSSTVPPSIGAAVTKSVPVLRNGHVKGVIVARAVLADMLLSPSSEDQAWAKQAIAYAIAQVANIALMEESFPRLYFSHIEARYEAHRVIAAQSAWAAYFSARASARLYPDAYDTLAEVCHRAATTAETDVAAARAKYQDDGHLDDLLAVANRRVETFLGAVARLLGHFDGMGREREAAQARFVNLFGSTPLANWLPTYHSDLISTWEAPDRWDTLRDFAVLGDHSQRLMWQFGLFPWQAGDGTYRLEVWLPHPLDTSPALPLPIAT